MYKNNVDKYKKLIFAFTDTRKAYRIIQFLIVFLMVATFVIILIGKRGEKNLISIKDNLFGKWNEVFIFYDNENLSYFKDHAFIKDYAIQKIYRRVILDNNKLIIGSCDKKFLNIGNVKMVSGKLPERENEIAIEKEYLSFLGVNNLGDIVPYNIGIDSLAGYKLCGIIENYSQRWDLVNSDLQYVNCFIFNDINLKCLQTNVYTILTAHTQQDLEINNSSYRKNIEVLKNAYFLKLISIWIAILIIFIIFVIKISKKIYYLKNNQEFIMTKINFNKKTRKCYFFIFLIFFCFTLNCLSLIIVNDLMNSVFLCNYNKNNSHIHAAINSDWKNGEKNIIINDSYSIYLENVNIYNTKRMLIMYYPNKVYEAKLQSMILITWLLLVNYIYIQMISYFIKYLVFHNEKQIVNQYFYNKNFLIMKVRICFIISWCIENLILWAYTYLCLCKITSLSLIINLFLYLFIINSIRLLINFVILNVINKKINKKIKLLLLTNWYS